MEDFGAFFQVLGFTFTQALASAVGAMFFGFFGALGLWSTTKSKIANNALMAFALLPNCLPIIFVIFSFMKYLPLARGFFGIILVHTFLNAGVVAIAIFQILKSKLGTLVELAWLEGSSQSRFLLRVVLPYLKSDFTRIFFFIFAISFTSFAVPLMIGGSQGTSIEVLIYEKIRISANWSQAMVLALGEVVFILFISTLVKRQVAVQATNFSRSPLLSSDIGIIILVLPSVFVCFCIFQSLAAHFNFWQVLGFWQALGFWQEVGANEMAASEVLGLTVGSYFVAIGSGIASLVLLLLTARYRPTKKLRSILLGLTSPSAVIIGFVLIWISQGTGIITLFKLILGLTLMHFPILYRLSWDSQIFALTKQIETAETLSASPMRTFSKIIAPQVLQGAYNLAGLAALWAFSDFTLASVVTERNLTLPQLFSHLTESYRWEQAENLMLPMIVGSILCYLLFSGVGYVASRSALR